MVTPVPKTPKTIELEKKAGVDTGEYDEQRDCLICQTPFMVNIMIPSSAKQIFCSYKCKTRGQHVRRNMRNNNFDGNIAEWLTLHPEKNAPKPIRALANPEARKLLKVHAEREVFRKEKAKADTAKTEKEIAQMQLEEKKRIDAAAKAEREAIQAAATSAGLIPLASTGIKSSLTDEQIDEIRGGISHIVNQQLLLADKVMTGGITWTPVQANLFKTLLNKVVPDAAAAKLKNADPGGSRSIDDLSVTELEELISRHSREKSIEGEVV